MTRIAAVLWSGTIGGAETFTADLCRAMRDLGASPEILFVTSGEPLSARLDAAALPHSSLGLSRGRKVIRHPRTLAKAVTALGPDGALVSDGGYLAAALRIGGYRGPIVAVVHSATVELGEMTLRDRLVGPLHRGAGFWASDIDVAVSDFVLHHLRGRFRRGRLVRIYNGVDLDLYRNHSRFIDSPPKIGSAGRLIRGKGVDVLLRSFAAAGVAREGVQLRIAGDGPARYELQRLAVELRLAGVVEFIGWTVDMPSFWRDCDIAVIPSDGCVESFGMSAVEAMACARPLVVTASGALPELVDDGVTGLVVPRGDARALREALVTLIRDPEKRQAVGRAARARCEQQFDILDCAATYLDLFHEVRAKYA